MDGHLKIFEIHANKTSKVENGERWHLNVSYDEEPLLGTMLKTDMLPECGGTIFRNMYEAYEDLSPDFKKFLDGLTAKHESEHFCRRRYAGKGVDDTNITYPQANHPVVRTHPQTGRKALFINQTYIQKSMRYQKWRVNAF